MKHWPSTMPFFYISTWQTAKPKASRALAEGDGGSPAFFHRRCFSPHRLPSPGAAAERGLTRGIPRDAVKSRRWPARTPTHPSAPCQLLLSSSERLMERHCPKPGHSGGATAAPPAAGPGGRWHLPFLPSWPGTGVSQAIRKPKLEH